MPAHCTAGSCNASGRSRRCDPKLCNEDGCTAPDFPTKFLTVKSVTQPGRDLTSDCAWPPDSLRWMLAQQALRRRSYNEVVFDAKPILAGFPRSVEAFFVPIGASRESYSRIAEVHRNFLAEYKASAEEVPLLTFSTIGGRGQKGPAGDPFTLLYPKR